MRQYPKKNWIKVCMLRWPARALDPFICMYVCMSYTSVYIHTQTCYTHTHTYCICTEAYTYIHIQGDSELRIRQNLHSALTRKFVGLVQEYQEMQTKYKNKYRCCWSMYLCVCVFVCVCVCAADNTYKTNTAIHFAYVYMCACEFVCSSGLVQEYSKKNEDNKYETEYSCTCICMRMCICVCVCVTFVFLLFLSWISLVSCCGHHKHDTWPLYVWCMVFVYTKSSFFTLNHHKAL